MAQEYTFRPSEWTLADQASQQERAAFIAKTYWHVLGAVLGFIAIEAFLLNIPGLPMAVAQIGAGMGWWWLLVLGAYMGVSYVADRWARTSESLAMQYAGLALYVCAFSALALLPLSVAMVLFSPTLILQAGLVTGITFTGLTLFVFATRYNFSFLAPFLAVGGIAALGIIAVSILFGFSLGVFFMGAMILFISAVILYQTSAVLHEYHTHQYVAAALALFASLATLFWYILQFMMAMQGEE